MMRSALGAAVSGGATGLYAWRFEPHWIRIVRRDMPLANLPAAMVGRTLVQISDLHVGPVVDENYITDAMKMVSALEADIVAVTGDFMTYRDRSQFKQVQRVLGHLKPGKLATLGVTGNHDFGPGFNSRPIADELERIVNDRGITLLRNRTHEVGGVQFVGVDDFWSDDFAPQVALPALHSDAATIALCHNPDAADVPVWRSANVRGWMLSGHTHGGQCRLPFCDPPRIPVANKRYTAGAIDLGGGRRMYINSGLGYLHRVRFLVRPEITVFTLRQASEA
jgi:uncharacterized protein